MKYYNRYEKKIITERDRDDPRRDTDVSLLTVKAWELSFCVLQVVDPENIDRPRWFGGLGGCKNPAHCSI